MKNKISKDIGILLNRKPGWFDLNIAYDLINKERKYAWGTGGIQLKPKDVQLPEGDILGLLKTSGDDEIIYGCTIDVSEEFRGYLNSNKAPEMKLKGEHKKYRPEHLKDCENKAILFLSNIFLLKNPIKYNQIKVLNGNKFKPKSHRAAVFIDIEKSNIDSIKILNEKKDFVSFSDNPFVQLLDCNKEDHLTNILVFLLKNNGDIRKEFLKLCDINRKSSSFEIYTRKRLELIKNRERSIPDITFEWQDGSSVLIEAKLFSSVYKYQLKKYKKYVNRDVICITRSGRKIDLNGVNFISWEEIYSCIDSVSIKNQEQKFIKKYFLGYLTNLGLSR